MRTVRPVVAGALGQGGGDAGRPQPSRHAEHGLAGPDRRRGQHEPVEHEMRGELEQHAVLAAGGIALAAVADDDRGGRARRRPRRACGRWGSRRRRGRAGRRRPTVSISSGAAGAVRHGGDGPYRARCAA